MFKIPWLKVLKWLFGGMAVIGTIGGEVVKYKSEKEKKKEEP